MSKYAINTVGLRKKPTIDELVDYIERAPDKIRYPDRRASQIRNSPYMTQFDGMTFEDLKMRIGS